jgi:hypothetical protein
MKPAPPGSRLRSFAGKVLVLGITSLVCVLLLEVAVRWLMPFYAPGSQIGFVPTTNGIVLGPANGTSRQATPKGDFDVTSHFNAEGFRDVKDFRQAGSNDWFAVGDSFTMGWGVTEEERYSNQLEKSLATAGGKTRVFNIAIPDNIIGYQRLLRHAESRGAKVHRMIVGICMENDLEDYRNGQGAWDSVFGGPGVMQPPHSQGSDSLRGWIKNHSALYNALSFNLQRVDFLRGFLQKVGITRNVTQLSRRKEWNEEVIHQSAAETAKLAAGRPAAVLIIPARLLWAGDNQDTERRVHEAFITELQKAGLRVVDMKPALEKSGNPLAFYFQNDPHWNAQGHELAAQELFKALQSFPVAP